MSLRGSVYALRYALTYLPALSDESSLATARAAVALLHHDALAQLLSFSAAPSALALRALSPRARLYAELHAAPCRDSRADGCASLRGGQLVYAIVALWGTGDVATLRTSLWWAERCDLPLTLEVDNTCTNVLDALSGSLRGRVTTLHLHFTTVAPCPSSKPADVHDAVTEQDGSSAGRHTRAPESPRSAACVCRRCPVSVAGLLPSLTALNSLFVDCYCDGPNGVRAAAVVAQLLQAAPPLTLREVKFSRCSFVHHPLVLSQLPHLRRLEVLSCEVRNLGDLKACVELEEVEVVFCDRLPSLADLRGAPQLHSLTAFLCGLRSLDGLSACPQLTELNVSHNPTLTSLSALEGAVRLRRLKAIKCRVRGVDGVGRCPSLTHIDVSFNTHLQTLTGLSGAPALVLLRAVHCGLRSVEGLKDCPLLAEVDVSTNHALDTLVGLAGAPGLEKLTAVGCNLLHLDGLNLCPLLTSVDVSNNHRLRSLSSLAGAPSLKKVRAAVCHVQSIRGLGSCPRLAEVDLSFNVQLSSVADLAGALQLRLVDVHATGVRNVSVLHACRSLVKVDASHCSSLEMDYHLPNVEVLTEKEKS